MYRYGNLGHSFLSSPSALGSAVIHADGGGKIEIEAGDRNGTFNLRVANTGSALSQEEAEEVFERFWRGDTARAGSGDHVGLGLSLVKKVTEILEGSLAVTSSPGGKFEIRFGVGPR